MLFPESVTVSLAGWTKALLDVRALRAALMPPPAHLGTNAVSDVIPGRDSLDVGLVRSPGRG